MSGWPRQWKHSVVLSFLLLKEKERTQRRGGGDCSFFLMMQCFADVFDKTIDLDVLGNV